MKVITIKSFLYRGVPEEFSNSYCSTGAPPTSLADWISLFNLFATNEKPIYPATVKFVRALGYNDANANAVASYAWTAGSEPVGTFAPSAGQPAMPGDVAAFISWPTDKRSSKGKIVYKRSYHHGVYAQAAPNEDYLASNQLSVMNTWQQGVHGVMGPGWSGLTLPDGTPTNAGTVHPFLTTRTLKRRGKRPPT